MQRSPNLFRPVTLANLRFLVLDKLLATSHACVARVRPAAMGQAGVEANASTLDPAPSRGG